MLKIEGSKAEMADEFGIRVGRWSQYPGAAGLPFGAMWCVIAPGGTSDPDRHPEVEFAVVISGTARYRVDDAQTEAHAGSVVLLEGGEGHTVHNPSTVDPLTILSLYWLPEDGDGR